MVIKTIVDEDFVNYKKPSMFIGTTSCNGKCCIEAGIPLSICQNDEWRSCATIDIDDDKLCSRYIQNIITSSVVFGGLEPFEQFEEMLSFISTLRNKYHCGDTVVIYTGYNIEEIEHQIEVLKTFENIIVKFGRFVPNQEPHFDEILGINLASDNQYAAKIS